MEKVMDYQLLKMLHILGSIIFIGNIVVTALWKAMADLTKNPKIVAFGQRLVTLTDFVFTGFGSTLVLVTGLLMAYQYFGDFLKIRWIAWGLGLFMLSGIIWATALIPVQIKQAQLARKFAEDNQIPPEYWRMGRIWMILGIIAIVLPLINLYFMVFKPTNRNRTSA
jgi:uncharacterized membrane protein